MLLHPPDPYPGHSPASPTPGNSAAQRIRTVCPVRADPEAEPSTWATQGRPAAATGLWPVATQSAGLTTSLPCVGIPCHRPHPPLDSRGALCTGDPAFTFP